MTKPLTSQSGSQPKGPYTLWGRADYGNWVWKDFDTLEDAVAASKWSDNWTIQKPVNYSVSIQVKEKE